MESRSDLWESQPGHEYWEEPPDLPLPSTLSLSLTPLFSFLLSFRSSPLTLSILIYSHLPILLLSSLFVPLFSFHIISFYTFLFLHIPLLNLSRNMVSLYFFTRGILVDSVLV